MIYISDYIDSCPTNCTNFPSVDTCVDGSCFCGAYRGPPCLGDADSCISGECKCGNGPACSGEAEICKNGSCECMYSYRNS